MAPIDPAQLRRLNAAGWSDTEIAGMLGASFEAVTKRRRRLGLVRGKGTPCGRRRRAETIRATTVVASLASRYRRDHPGDTGWPGELSPLGVKILDALWEYGPLTRAELSTATGRFLAGGDNGRILPYLIRAGLVVDLGCLGGGPVYSLALTASKGSW